VEVVAPMVGTFYRAPANLEEHWLSVARSYAHHERQADPLRRDEELRTE